MSTGTEGILIISGASDIRIHPSDVNHGPLKPQGASDTQSDTSDALKQEKASVGGVKSNVDVIGEEHQYRFNPPIMRDLKAEQAKVEAKWDAQAYDEELKRKRADSHDWNPAKEALESKNAELRDAAMISGIQGDAFHHNIIYGPKMSEFPFATCLDVGVLRKETNLKIKDLSNEVGQLREEISSLVSNLRELSLEVQRMKRVPETRFVFAVDHSTYDHLYYQAKAKYSEYLNAGHGSESFTVGLVTFTKGMR